MRRGLACSDRQTLRPSGLGRALQALPLFAGSRRCHAAPGSALVRTMRDLFNGCWRRGWQVEGVVDLL